MDPDAWKDRPPRVDIVAPHGKISWAVESTGEVRRLDRADIKQAGQNKRPEWPNSARHCRQAPKRRCCRCAARAREKALAAPPKRLINR